MRKFPRAGAGSDEASTNLKREFGQLVDRPPLGDRDDFQWIRAPGWPRAVDGWRPEPGWRPAPDWPPPPEGWAFWIRSTQDPWLESQGEEPAASDGRRTVAAMSPSVPDAVAHLGEAAHAFKTVRESHVSQLQSLTQSLFDLSWEGFVIGFNPILKHAQASGRKTDALRRAQREFDLVSELVTRINSRGTSTASDLLAEIGRIHEATKRCHEIQESL